MSYLLNKKIKLDPAFWTKTSWIQLLYGVWVNMAQFGIGLAFGLPAVQVPQLSSPDSDIKITRSEASWIASVLTLFSPIGCLLSGYCMDRFGRKIMIVLCQAPMSIGWLYTGLAKNAKHIIIGRVITGIGCGMAMGPPRIYSTEISLPNMRGVIGAFPALALSIGICLQAGLGHFFVWQILCYICCGLTSVNLILFNLLPETPYYVLKAGTAEEARTTLAKFRDSKYDLDTEMTQLIEFKTDNDIRKLTVAENITALFTRASCLPFTLINIYVLFSQLSGINCILMWTIEILTAAKSSFNVHTGNFLMALTRLIVGTLTSILLFSVGRKPLALTSALGVSFISLSLGFYIHYNDEPSLIPQVYFMAFMAFASLGYTTLPFLMASELFPLQVRGTLGGMTVSITSVLIFASTKFYPLLRDNIGLANTMLLFGSSSFCCAIFLYFFLPETKDLTLQEIEEFYNSRRSTLVSQRLITSMHRQQSNHSKTTTKSKSKSISNRKLSGEKQKNIKMASDNFNSGAVLKLDSNKKDGDNSESSSSISLKKETLSMGKTSLIIKEPLDIKISSKIKIKKHDQTEESDNIKEPLKSKEFLKDIGSAKYKESMETKEPDENEDYKPGKDRKKVREFKKKVITSDETITEPNVSAENENQPSTSKKNTK